jgi:predicted  nucleic acid-binding Zn-ribbon protein
MHSPSPSTVNLSSLANKTLRQGGSEAPQAASSGVDNEVMKTIAATLSENGFTEQDIWDASPALQPILQSIRPQLDALMKPSTNVIISVDFTHCEDFSKLGFSYKVYKVDPTKPVWQTVALIFTKIGPALAAANNGASTNHRRYCLRTAAGNILDDNGTLTAFGLGSLFHNWELTMIRKTAEQFAAARPSTTPTVSGQFVVTFLPGDGPMFNGISKLIQRVHTDTPTGQLIEKFCRRYGIPEPERFGLASTSDMILSRNQSLGYYGLGKKFDQMTVKVVLRTDGSDEIAVPSKPSTGATTDAVAGSPGSQSALSSAGAPQMSGFNASVRPSLRMGRQSIVVSPDVAWTQLDDHLSVREARAVILDLDKQLGETKAQLQASIQQRAEERETIRGVMLKEREAYKELETQHDQLRLQAKKLVDVYVSAKERQEDLLVAKGALEADIVSMRGLMSRARDELMQSRADSNTKAEQIRTLQGELLAQQFDFEQVKMGLETKIDQLDRDLQTETQKTLQLYSEHIAMQDVIETQKSQIGSLKTAKASLETQLTEAMQLEAQLTSEVSQLKKEVATAQYSENQVKVNLASANDEITMLASKAESLAAEKRTLEHTLASTKASLNSAIEERDGEIRSVKQQLDTLAREKQDDQARFEQQLKGLQESLQSTVSSQSGLQQETTKTKEALLNATAQVDSLKSANQSLSERLEASSAEVSNLRRQLTESKDQADQLRSDLRETSVGVSVGGDVEHFRKQIAQLKEQIANEQKAGFESKQAKEELSARIATQQTQLSTANAKVAELTEELRVEKQTKHDAAVLAEKEAFKELNAKLTKTVSEKTDLERQLKDAHTEKSDIERQLKESTQTVKEQAALIKEQKERIDVLEAPPPAPVAPSHLKSSSQRNVAQSNSKATLETEILGIKDTLQKIDTSALSKKKDFTNENVLSSLLMSGLEKRFRAARPADDYEDLASEDIYIPNENEEDWR